jgi:hypothetical protein
VQAPTPPPLDAGLVRDFQDRQRCNLLNGCGPLERLGELGGEAVPSACAFYRDSARDADKYYRSQVLLGVARAAAKGCDEGCRKLAEDCLRGGLAARSWMEQTEAAFGLGELKAAEALPDLQRLQQSQPNLAVRAGVMYALARLGAGPDLAQLWAELDPQRADVANWGFLRYVVRAAAGLGARDQALAVAGLVKHPDYYLKREALRALASFKHPSTLEAALAALDDQYPGIRRAAVETLQAITGLRALTTVEQWLAWRQENEQRQR